MEPLNDDCGCVGKSQIERALNQQPMNLRTALSALRGGMCLSSSVEEWSALRAELLLAKANQPLFRLEEEIARLDKLYVSPPEML